MTRPAGHTKMLYRGRRRALREYYMYCMHTFKHLLRILEKEIPHMHVQWPLSSHTSIPRCRIDHFFPAPRTQQAAALVLHTFLWHMEQIWATMAWQLISTWWCLEPQASSTDETTVCDGRLIWLKHHMNLTLSCRSWVWRRPSWLQYVEYVTVQQQRSGEQSHS